MAKNGVEIKDINIAKRSKKISRKYRREMFESLARSLDNIRLRAANDFIIPSRYSGLHPSRQARLQPSSATQLTSRTGLLVRMLKEAPKSWKFSTTRAILKTSALQGSVRISGGKGTDKETYTADLKVQISKTSKIIGFVRAQVPSARMFNKKGEFATRKISARFLHDRPQGVRGRRRPFIEPATKQERIRTSDIIGRKLAELKAGF